MYFVINIYAKKKIYIYIYKENRRYVYIKKTVFSEMLHLLNIYNVWIFISLTILHLWWLLKQKHDFYFFYVTFLCRYNMNEVKRSDISHML